MLEWLDAGGGVINDARRDRGVPIQTIWHILDKCLRTKYKNRLEEEDLHKVTLATTDWINNL